MGTQDDDRGAAVDRLLEELPEGHVVASRGAARLVVGPNGGFVVVPSGSRDGGLDVTRAARLASSLAEEARAALVDGGAFAPFLDAIVVSSGRRRSGVEAACVVPLDLLAQVLVEGPPVVGRGVLDRVSELLGAGEVAGWVPGVGAEAAMIDLCEETESTTS